MTNSTEFSPYAYFDRIINFWWLVCVTTFVGGALGFLIFHFHPPVYEAEASYVVTIDMSRFPLQDMREEVILYNEDMAVNSTQTALFSDEVMKEVTGQLDTLGTPVNAADLLKNYTIERKHEIWEFRYRSQNPAQAQTIVNTWVEIGYQAMLSWQAKGLVPNYVIFQPPSRAALPTQPVLDGRNNLMLAGALIGLIIGILLSTQIAASSSKPLKRRKENRAG